MPSTEASRKQQPPDRTARESNSLIALLVAAAAAGCGQSSATPRADGSPDGAPPGDRPRADAGMLPGRAPAASRIDCPDPTLRVLRASGWPGSGLQLAFQLRDEDGAPRSALDDATLELASEDDSHVRMRLEPAAHSAGLTAIVIVPAEQAREHEQRLAAARALVEALPQAERIAVWVGVEQLPLAAELTERRAHVLERIAAIAPQPAGPIGRDAQAMFASRLATVESPWGPIGRNLVVIGDPGADGFASDAARAELPPVIVRYTLDAGDAGLDPAADAARWGDGTEPEQAAQQLAGHIAERRAHTVIAGACGPFVPGSRLTLVSDGARCTFPAPTPPAHLAGASCSALAAARDDYPFPTLIELQMTEQELALHDQYDADKDEHPVTMRVVFDDAEPIEASGHFRGQTALDCARKNYSINLEGGEPRRLMPGAANDEFYLISMCNEPYFFYQVIASRMMRALGLFPLEQRYVRLRVAGRERGVYLLLEEPDETLFADQAELAGVVRRRMDADRKKPEVKYPDAAEAPEAAAAALAQYSALIEPIDSAAPEDLFVELSRNLDFDNYLRWIALNTYLRCGDYVDETFFYASREIGAEGGGYYFRNLGWDADDLFAGCHHKGARAYPDPFGIVYCAEGNLDRSLFVSDDVYARFIDTLSVLMRDTFPPQAIEAELAEVRAELFALMHDESVCAGMTPLFGPDYPDCSALRAVIRAGMDDFVQLADERAVSLSAAIGAWELSR